MNLLTPLGKSIFDNEEASPEMAEGEFEMGRRQGVVDIAQAISIKVKEMPWHKALIALLAKGASQSEAAALVDCQQYEVSALLRQEWFQAKLASAMSEEIEPMAALFKGASILAFTTIVEICNNPKVTHSVKLSAAKELLDRHLGKSTQFLEVKSESRNTNVVEENKALEQEAKMLNERLGIIC